MSRGVHIMIGVFFISKKTEAVIEALVEPVITSAGYEYIGTEINTVSGTKELVIYADKQGGINLDDCERISRLIEPIIDENDPINDAYCLCVSSPGLDRVLKTQRDFIRETGKLIDIKLFKADNGIKEFTGKLIRSDEKGFTIEADGKEKPFDLKDVAIARLHVDI